MAITKSAKKAAKRSVKNYEINLGYKNRMKKAIKNFLKALDNKEKYTELSVLLSQAYKYIDKAAKKGIIKKQTAARKKSRLAIKVS